VCGVCVCVCGCVVCVRVCVCVCVCTFTLMCQCQIFFIGSCYFQKKFSKNILAVPRTGDVEVVLMRIIYKKI